MSAYKTCVTGERMRILITGSKGVLGTVLTRTLRLRGHDVFGCDLMHSEDPNYMRADINNLTQLGFVFSRFSPDIVFHLAAEFGRVNGEEFYEQLLTTNILGLQNVISQCVSDNVPLVFASSSEAYGLSELYVSGQPLYENLLNSFCPRFHNKYALTKFVGEQLIDVACRTEGLNAIVLRFFNVYGPPEPYNPYRSVVCQFAYKILKGLPVVVTKDGYRSHLWIGDWADTVANVADKYDQVIGKTFNIGSDDYESIPVLAAKLVKIINPTNQNISYIDSETNNSPTKKPDNTQARVWLNHNPKMPLELGLQMTVDWMRREYGL